MPTVLRTRRRFVRPRRGHLWQWPIYQATQPVVTELPDLSAVETVTGRITAIEAAVSHPAAAETLLGHLGTTETVTGRTAAIEVVLDRTESAE